MTPEIQDAFNKAKKFTGTDKENDVEWNMLRDSITDSTGIDLRKRQTDGVLDLQGMSTEGLTELSESWGKKVGQRSTDAGSGKLNNYIRGNLGLQADQVSTLVGDAMERGDLTQDQATEIEEAAAAKRRLIRKTSQIGMGASSVVELSGIAEGVEGASVSFRGEDGEKITKDASEMSAEEKRTAILQRLQDTESFGGDAEAQQQAADDFMKFERGRKMAQDEAGVLLGNTQRTANMYSSMTRDASMSSLRTSDFAREQSQIAKVAGGKQFLDFGMDNPLQNMLFGLMGDDAEGKAKLNFETLSEMTGEDGELAFKKENIRC